MLLLSLLLGSAAAPAQDVAAASFEGRTIGRVEFDPPNQPLPSDELERLLPFHAGSSLKMEDVRSAIQKLYRTGRYSDVSIDAEPEPGTAANGPVVLRIATELKLFRRQRDHGWRERSSQPGQLTTATKLELGMPLEPGALGQAIKNMQERFRANGLYQTTVHYDVSRDPSTEDANIRFEIDAGDRARFDGMRVSGHFTESVDRIIRATHWRRGFGPFQFPGWHDVTENRMLNGLDRIRKNFQDRNLLEARVFLDHMDYQDKTNTVTPSLQIDAGPVVKVNTIGAKVSSGQLHSLIPIFEERSVDRSLLLEGQRNLTEYFQSIGYFDASVQFDQENQEDAVQVIDYTIDRGERHHLARVEIAGNHAFTADLIRERMSITAASFPRYRFGRFSQKLSEDDRATIIGLYRANGYRAADVKTSVIDNYHGQQTEIAVRFDITEGPRWLVNQLDLEGISDADKKYLQTILQAIPGEPYSETAVAADRDTILSFYFNNGYPDATFDWTETPGPAPDRPNLQYVIHPGERQFVRQVLVRGLVRTNPTLVANRISLAAGRSDFAKPNCRKPAKAVRPRHLFQGADRHPESGGRRGKQVRSVSDRRSQPLFV